MARMAFEEYGAKWVFHADADEFWWPEGEYRTLAEIFESTDEGLDGMLVERSNFVPLEDRLRNGPFFSDLVYRETSSVNALGLPLPPKVFHRGAGDILIDQGNHAFRFEGREARVERNQRILIWHFPILDFESFERKIRVGGAAYARNTRLPESVGSTWRRLAALADEGGLRAYYDEQTYSPLRLADLVRSGKLVRDDRFARYMRELLEAAPTP